MSEIRAERLSAEVDGEFVVFLIGMRVNRIWKLQRWLAVAIAMGAGPHGRRRSPALTS